MPKSAEQLIVDYESHRVRVRNIGKAKGALIDKCEKYNWPKRENCLQEAWKAFTSDDNHSGAHGEGFAYDFQDIINNEAENEGEYCKHCRMAFALKIGALANAKRDYGNAKRAISARGKKLLKESNSE